VATVLLCGVQGAPQAALPPPGEDPAADICFLRTLGVLQDFPESWLSENGPVSPGEALVLCARVHSYVTLRIGEQDVTQPLDRLMRRLYALRKAQAAPLYGINPDDWAYPAALYIQWVDEVAPGRAEQVLSLAGRPRYECYAAARSTIEKAWAAYEEAQADPLMQWEAE